MFKIGFPSLVLGGVLALGGPVTSAQASLVQFQFNGTGGGETIQALLGIDSSLVVANGSFTQANLSSFSVQVTGSVSGSSTAIPASLSGQFNSSPTPVFSALSSTQSLTIPSYGGTNVFNFFNPNGQSWQFAGSGSVSPPAGPFNFVGTGTWSQVAVVPIPAALWLFGSGIAAVTGFARRHTQSRKA